MWVDDPPALVKTDSYWSRLRNLGVEVAALMVDSTARGFGLIYSVRDLSVIAELARQHDIGLVATVWPEPSPRAIDAMVAGLEPILGLGFIGLENDVEMNWRTDKVRGFPSLDAAAVYLTSKERELCNRHDLSLEMTTHTGHREAGPRAFLARLVDRVYYQLYSTESDWQGRPVAWDGPRGPGTLQREFIQQVLQDISELGVEDQFDVELAAGLAFYDQRWSGHSVEEALNLAYNAVKVSGIRSIRGWSSKWTAGVRSQSTTQLEVSAWLQREFGVTKG